VSNWAAPSRTGWFQIFRPSRPKHPVRIVANSKWVRIKRVLRIPEMSGRRNCLAVGNRNGWLARRDQADVFSEDWWVLDADLRTLNTTRAPTVTSAVPARDTRIEAKEPVGGSPLPPPLVPEAVTVTVVAVVVDPSVTVMVWVPALAGSGWWGW
jgi:hypothetical protein